MRSGSVWRDTPSVLTIFNVCHGDPGNLTIRGMLFATSLCGDITGSRLYTCSVMLGGLTLRTLV